MFDVVAVGETLIDFTPSGANELGMALFACNPGGAPANVLAMHSKLGGGTAFIGKVGDDEFGRFLTRTMEQAGVDTSGVVRTAQVPTTLAFVQLDEKGDRTFSFYRKPGADVCLTQQEINLSLCKACHVFHFGSVSLTDEPCRGATLAAVNVAKSAGAIISYDPNYRPALWQSEAEAAAQMKNALQYAHIVKVSEEEMLLLTGETDLHKGADALLQSGAVLVLVTLGAQGSFCKNTTATARKPTFNVKTIDTTGAGDAFLGAFLYQLQGKSVSELQKINQTEMEKMLDFANAAGSLTTTQKGAIPAMPSKDAIEQCISNISLID